MTEAWLCAHRPGDKQPAKATVHDTEAEAEQAATKLRAQGIPNPVVYPVTLED